MGVVDEKANCSRLDTHLTDSDRLPISSGVRNLNMQSRLGNCKAYLATLLFGSTD